MLYRIVKVLHDSYKDGYIPITDHFSFIITLIARFRVVRGGSCLESASFFFLIYQCFVIALPYSIIMGFMFISDSAIESVERRETTFKALTELVCAYLSRMGDSFIVLQIIEKVCVEQTVSFVIF